MSILELFWDMTIPTEDFNWFLNAIRVYRRCVFWITVLDPFCLFMASNPSTVHEWKSNFLDIPLKRILKVHYFNLSVTIRIVLFVIDIAIVSRIRDKYANGNLAINLVAKQSLVLFATLKHQSRLRMIIFDAAATMGDFDKEGVGLVSRAALSRRSQTSNRTSRFMETNRI